MKPVTPEQEARLAEVWRLRMEGTQAAEKRQNEDAEAFYWQALCLHEEVLGATSPGIMDSLGALIFEFGCQFSLNFAGCRLISFVEENGL